MAWPRGVKRTSPTMKLAEARAAEKPAEKPAKPKPAEPKSEPKTAEAKPKKVSWTSRAGNDWRVDAGFVSRIRDKKGDAWEDTTGEDRLRIAPEIVEGLRQNGIVLQWVCHEVYGRTETQHISHYLRGGWEYVKPGDIEGIDVVEIDGLKLMARHIEIHKKALKHQAALARQPVADREALLTGGVPLPSGAGAHHRARETNFIRRSMEKIELGEVARDD